MGSPRQAGLEDGQEKAQIPLGCNSSAKISKRSSHRVQSPGRLTTASRRTSSLPRRPPQPPALTPVLTARVVVDAATASSSIDIIDCRLKGRTDPGRAGGYIVLSQNRVSCRRGCGSPPPEVTHPNRTSCTLGAGVPSFLLPGFFLTCRPRPGSVQSVSQVCKWSMRS